MKLLEPFTAIFVAVIVVAAGYSIFMKVKPGVLPEDSFIEDVIIEPIAEMVLDLEPGSLDLTPHSTEQKERLREDLSYLKLSDEAKI